MRQIIKSNPKFTEFSLAQILSGLKQSAADIDKILEGTINTG